MPSERQLRYEERMRERGMVRRSYWVPSSRETEIKRFIQQQTNEAK